MRTTTVIAALLLAGATAYECSDQDSCSDCAGLAGCGWDQYLENCKDDDHFSEGSVYVESSTACECMQANDQGCEACGDVAVFCGYVSRTGTAPLPHLASPAPHTSPFFPQCPGSNGYNQCTEDNDWNEDACYNWEDTFDCDQSEAPPAAE